MSLPRKVIASILILASLLQVILFAEAADQRLTNGVWSSVTSISSYTSPLTYVLDVDASKDVIVTIEKSSSSSSADLDVVVGVNEYPTEYTNSYKLRVGPGVTKSSVRCLTAVVHSGVTVSYYIRVYSASTIPYSFKLKAESSQSVAKKVAGGMLAVAIIVPSVCVLCCLAVVILCIIGCVAIARGGNKRTVVYQPPLHQQQQQINFGAPQTGYTSLQDNQQYLMSPNNMYAPSAQPVQQVPYPTYAPQPQQGTMYPVQQSQPQPQQYTPPALPENV